MREVSGGGGSALAGRRSMLSLDRLIPRLEATVNGTRDPVTADGLGFVVIRQRMRWRGCCGLLFPAHGERQRAQLRRRLGLDT